MFEFNSFLSRTYMAVTPHNFVKIYLLRHRLGTMLVYCTKNCMLLDPSGDKAVDIPT